MEGIKIFQCIPAYKPAATSRLIKSLCDIDCKILLDIEDSIQDVMNPEQTSTLKQKARHNFEKIIKLIPDKKFSLRINFIRGKEFQHDISLLEKFSDKIDTIFIPKIESSKDIADFYAAISHRYKLNLIVETQKGIENLDDILGSPFKNNINYVFFGNYDYHLDNNIYPIIEQHTLKYWKIVEPIINKVESHQIKYGNSPYSNIADKASLNFSLMQLTKLCKTNFALMSLHKEQTRHFKKLIDDWQLSLTKTKAHQKNSFSLSTFTQHRQKGRSFSFFNNRIITPQEYLLVLRKKMDKINIGFIGGCINKQSGISRDELYYSVMTKNLKESKNNKNYQVSLSTYLSFDQLAAKAKEFISKKKPEIIFLFIRPFPLMPLQKLFVKYSQADGIITRTIHPALFNRHLVWKDSLTKYQSANGFVFVPKNKIGLRDLNLIAGIALGLHHWTRRYVAKQVQLVKQLCDQDNIQLKIISPPQNPESIIANLTCKWITNFMESYCKLNKLGFININKFGIDKFEQDKIHFNILGHQQLGQLIYANLS